MNYIQTCQLIERCRELETTRISHEICDWDGKCIRMNVTCGLVYGIMGEISQKFTLKRRMSVIKGNSGSPVVRVLSEIRSDYQR